VDEVDAINKIMKVTGERTESAVLRKLVDDALDARRKKSHAASLTEESDDAARDWKRLKVYSCDSFAREAYHFASKTSVWRFYRTSFAEAYATRRLLWKSVVLPQLRDAEIAVIDLF
jgi:hypothetical protein